MSGVKKGQAVKREKNNTKTHSSAFSLEVLMYLKQKSYAERLLHSKAVGPFAICDSSQEFAARNNQCIDGLVAEL